MIAYAICHHFRHNFVYSHHSAVGYWLKASSKLRQLFSLNVQDLPNSRRRERYIQRQQWQRSTVVKKHSLLYLTPPESCCCQSPGNLKLRVYQVLPGQYAFLDIFNTINVRLMAKMVVYTRTRFNILALTPMEKGLV